jgi:hypothetical protein
MVPYPLKNTQFLFGSCCFVVAVVGWAEKVVRVKWEKQFASNLNSTISPSVLGEYKSRGFIRYGAMPTENQLNCDVDAVL